jgi:long-chain fatty acid transport protein
LDRQWRYATGIQYDLSADMTIGCAYEFLDAGDAEINQNRGALAGAIVGDYSSNYIHFFNVNLIKRF